jgi:hypothetical protein
MRKIRKVPAGSLAMGACLLLTNLVAWIAFLDSSFRTLAESGITPDRADKRNALLGPGFAEAFFGRGVANFICTAWPINDTTALEFARRMYRGLLGLQGSGQAPEPIHEALSAARQEIARLGLGGLQTWGAYQHYGDPFFRFFSDAEQKSSD